MVKSYNSYNLYAICRHVPHYKCTRCGIIIHILVANSVSSITMRVGVKVEDKMGWKTKARRHRRRRRVDETFTLSTLWVVYLSVYISLLPRSICDAVTISKTIYLLICSVVLSYTMNDCYLVTRAFDIYIFKSLYLNYIWF